MDDGTKAVKKKTEHPGNDQNNGYGIKEIAHKMTVKVKLRANPQFCANRGMRVGQYVILLCGRSDVGGVPHR